MRIYMQTIPVPDEPMRYCHLHLQQDLISGWSFVRENGVQGQRGQVKRQHFEQREQAEQALISWRDRQVKRGYRVMFREGTFTS